jgi:hypothetical protein
VTKPSRTLAGANNNKRGGDRFEFQTERRGAMNGQNEILEQNRERNQTAREKNNRSEIFQVRSPVGDFAAEPVTET